MQKGFFFANQRKKIYVFCFSFFSHVQRMQRMMTKQYSPLKMLVRSTVFGSILGVITLEDPFLGTFVGGGMGCLFGATFPLSLWLSTICIAGIVYRADKKECWKWMQEMKRKKRKKV